VIGREDGRNALRPIARVSLKDAIIERLGRLIDEKQLGTGARLPPELTLARSLGVSRSSVREAVSALVSYGLLARRAGFGTYVTSGVGPLVARGLALRLTLEPQDFRHILEARKVLEGEFAYLAAIRADREDLQAIDTHLTAMRLHARNPEISVKEDFAFHMAIARSAKNPILFDVLNYLSDLVFRSHRAVTQSGGLSPGAMAFHERIAAAIGRRSAHEARRLMLQHLDDVIRRADQLYGRHLRASGSAGRHVRTRSVLGSGRARAVGSGGRSRSNGHSA
jgi:GntR family transcriptional repressor for pyruvate dehydrogenase complex